jgi:hypothetical protein
MRREAIAQVASGRGWEEWIFYAEIADALAVTQVLGEQAVALCLEGASDCTCSASRVQEV